MADIYEWHVTDPRQGRTLSTHRSVDAAFAARGPQHLVFVVLLGDGFRARVLRPG